MTNHNQNRNWRQRLNEMLDANVLKDDSLELGDSWKAMPRRTEVIANRSSNRLYRRCVETPTTMTDVYNIIIGKKAQKESPIQLNMKIVPTEDAEIDSTVNGATDPVSPEELDFTKFLRSNNETNICITSTPYSVARKIDDKISSNFMKPTKVVPVSDAVKETSPVIQDTEERHSSNSSEDLEKTLLQHGSSDSHVQETTSPKKNERTLTNSPTKNCQRRSNTPYLEVVANDTHSTSKDKKSSSPIVSSTVNFVSPDKDLNIHEGFVKPQDKVEFLNPRTVRNSSQKYNTTESSLKCNLQRNSAQNIFSEKHIAPQIDPVIDKTLNSTRTSKSRNLKRQINGSVNDYLKLYESIRNKGSSQDSTSSSNRRKLYLKGDSCDETILIDTMGARNQLPVESVNDRSKKGSDKSAVKLRCKAHVNIEQDGPATDDINQQSNETDSPHLSKSPKSQQVRSNNVRVNIEDNGSQINELSCRQSKVNNSHISHGRKASSSQLCLGNVEREPETLTSDRGENLDIMDEFSENDIDHHNVRNDKIELPSLSQRRQVGTKPTLVKKDSRQDRSNTQFTDIENGTREIGIDNRYLSSREELVDDRNHLPDIFYMVRATDNKRESAKKSQDRQRPSNNQNIEKDGSDKSHSPHLSKISLNRRASSNQQCLNNEGSESDSLASDQSEKLEYSDELGEDTEEDEHCVNDLDHKVLNKEIKLRSKSQRRQVGTNQQLVKKVSRLTSREEQNKATDNKKQSAKKSQDRQRPSDNQHIEKDGSDTDENNEQVDVEVEDSVTNESHDESHSPHLSEISWNRRASSNQQCSGNEESESDTLVPDQSEKLGFMDDLREDTEEDEPCENKLDHKVRKKKRKFPSKSQRRQAGTNQQLVKKVSRPGPSKTQSTEIENGTMDVGVVNNRNNLPDIFDNKKQSVKKSQDRQTSSIKENTENGSDANENNLQKRHSLLVSMFSKSRPFLSNVEEEWCESDESNQQIDEIQGSYLSNISKDQQIRSMQHHEDEADGSSQKNKRNEEHVANNKKLAKKANSLHVRSNMVRADSEEDENDIDHSVGSEKRRLPSKKSKQRQVSARTQQVDKEYNKYYNDQLEEKSYKKRNKPGKKTELKNKNVLRSSQKTNVAPATNKNTRYSQKSASQPTSKDNLLSSGVETIEFETNDIDQASIETNHTRSSERSTKSKENNGEKKAKKKSKFERAHISTYDPLKPRIIPPGVRHSARTKRGRDTSFLQSIFEQRKRKPDTRIDSHPAKKMSRKDITTNDVYSMVLDTATSNLNFAETSVFEGIEITRGFQVTKTKNMIISHLPTKETGPSYGYISLNPLALKKPCCTKTILHLHFISGSVVVIINDKESEMKVGSLAVLPIGTKYALRNDNTETALVFFNQNLS